MAKIALIACSDKKRESTGTMSGLIAAKDLYLGDLYKASVAWVEKNCDGFFILSAKHGLLAPDDWIEPYNKTLKTMPASERNAWDANTRHAILMRVPSDATLVFLGGNDYAGCLLGLPHVVERPIATLPIGKQKQALIRGSLASAPAWVSGPIGARGVKKMNALRGPCEFCRAGHDFSVYEGQTICAKCRREVVKEATRRQIAKNMMADPKLSGFISKAPTGPIAKSKPDNVTRGIREQIKAMRVEEDALPVIEKLAGKIIDRALEAATGTRTKKVWAYDPADSGLGGTHRMVRVDVPAPPKKKKLSGAQRRKMQRESGSDEKNWAWEIACSMFAAVGGTRTDAELFAHRTLTEHFDAWQGRPWNGDQGCWKDHVKDLLSKQMSPVAGGLALKSAFAWARGHDEDGILHRGTLAKKHIHTLSCLNQTGRLFLCGQ